MMVIISNTKLTFQTSSPELPGLWKFPITLYIQNSCLHVHCTGHDAKHSRSYYTRDACHHYARGHTLCTYLCSEPRRSCPAAPCLPPYTLRRFTQAFPPWNTQILKENNICDNDVVSDNVSWSLFTEYIRDILYSCICWQQLRTSYMCCLLCTIYVSLI